MLKTDFGYQKGIDGSFKGTSIFLFISPGKTAEIECPADHYIDVFTVNTGVTVEANDVGVNESLSSFESTNVLAGSRSVLVNITANQDTATVLVTFNSHISELESIPSSRRNRRRGSKAAEQQMRIAKEKGMDIAITNTPIAIPTTPEGINSKPQFEVMNKVII